MRAGNFADRLAELVQQRRSQVVVGLDPRWEMLPASIKGQADAPTADDETAADAFLRFNSRVIQAVADLAVAVKVQIAFYECYGCAGMRAYAETIKAARQAGLVVIGDVKRSDIASTAEAYARAHLGEGDFGADAVTVNPYLGSDGVRPFIEEAARRGKGVFVLVKTSNPSSSELQDLPAGDAPLHECVAALVEGWGEPYRGRLGYSLVGAVVGATYPERLVRLRRVMPHAVLLVPGFGAQGAGVGQVLGAFHAGGQGAVVNSSRGIIFAWRREPFASRFGEGRWLDAVREATEQMRAALWSATR